MAANINWTSMRCIGRERSLQADGRQPHRRIGIPGASTRESEDASASLSCRAECRPVQWGVTDAMIDEHASGCRNELGIPTFGQACLARGIGSQIEPLPAIDLWKRNALRRTAE